MLGKRKKAGFKAAVVGWGAFCPLAAMLHGVCDSGCGMDCGSAAHCAHPQRAASAKH